MGVKYSPLHVAKCWSCEDGFMIGQRAGNNSVRLSCRQCENAFPTPYKGDVRVETLGIAYGVDAPLDGARTLDEVVNTAMGADGMVVLDLDEARPLYYSLHDDEPCPVRGCNGTLRQTGSRAKHSATTQLSCRTCDFETFEKDVS